MNNSELIEQLKSKIKLHLNLIKEKDLPKVYQMANNPATYHDMETLILKKIQTEGITISGAITEIETELNPNILD